MTFPCCGHKQVAPVGFQSRGILGLGLTILAITSLSAGRWWMNKKQSNVQMDVSPSSEVHDIVPVPAVQTKATDQQPEADHRTETGAEFKNSAAAPESEAPLESQTAPEKKAVTKSEKKKAVKKCLLEAKSYQYRYKAQAQKGDEKLEDAHFVQADGVYIPKLAKTWSLHCSKYKRGVIHDSKCEECNGTGDGFFLPKKDDILVSFKYHETFEIYGTRSGKVHEYKIDGRWYAKHKLQWHDKLIRVQNGGRLVSMKFVHKDDRLRMTQPLTVKSKDDFKPKFVGQTNKLTLNNGSALFMLFGKEAELVKFQAHGANTPTKTSDGNWKTAFDTALGACKETPLDMWFRGINTDCNRRRLSALSERFCRVREFQASTEM